MGVKVKDKTLLITIDDEISTWWGISHKEIADGIEAGREEGFTSIQMKINSPGGSVTEGNAIRGEILDLVDEGFDVDIEIMGVAASIASVIALSGTSLKMRVGSYLMIHEPATIMRGTWRVLQNMAKTIKKMWGDAVAIYVENSNKTKEDIEQMMADETWMTAKEALSFGFASAVTVSKKGEVTNQSICMFKDSTMMESFTNIPKDLLTLMNKKIDKKKPVSKKELPMKLDEAIKTNPDIQNEVDAEKVTAKDEGAREAATRISSLLALAGGVMTPLVEAAIKDGSSRAELALAMVEAGVIPVASSTPAPAKTAEELAALAKLGQTDPLTNMTTIPPVAPISELDKIAEIADKADDAAFEALFEELDLNEDGDE